MSFQLEYDPDSMLKSQVPIAVKVGHPLTKKEELQNPEKEIWVCMYLYFHALEAHHLKGAWKFLKTKTKS